MPKKLEDCLREMKKKGVPDDEAYRYCVKSTGYVRGKNKDGKATWVKKGDKK